MGSIMDNIFGNVTNKSADETLAYTAMAGAASAASAYLAATLTSTTPEVRRLFGEYTTQSVMAHEALNALSIKKGWMTPYEKPVDILQTTFNQSQNVIAEA